MEWIEPKYSKEQVRKAGKHAAFSDLESQEFLDSIPIFYNWRSAHAFPMQIMLDLLRKTAIRIDKKAVVVQRLKRDGSILAKLMREKNMSLSRMEDIAGCRAVVNNIGNAINVYETLKKSKTKNILYRDRDYISSPKESGYRALHLVFKYNGGKEKYRGMAVELQIRSKIQHSWATAVEVVGTFTKQALKASTGEAIWLDFFKYTSVEFTKLEGSPIDSRYESIDTFMEIDKRVQKLGLRDRLLSFKVAAKTLSLDRKTGAAYFILILDLDKKFVQYMRYGKNQLSKATQYYDKLEEKYRRDENKDVVLVSAASVRDLKKAYPNYFSDTDDFQQNLAKVYEINKHVY